MDSTNQEALNKIKDDNENYSTQPQSDIDIKKLRQICSTDGYQSALYHLAMQIDKPEPNVNDERKQTIINIANKYNMEDNDIHELCKLLE